MIQILRNQFSMLFKSSIDVSTPEGRAKRRAHSIALTAMTAVVAKVFSMIIPLITVRVSLNYLGAEIYGLWMTVTSFFALFTFADLGLGNGLQTNLSQANGKENNANECRQLISSTYFILLIIAGVLTCLFLGIYSFVHWDKLVNAKTEISARLSGPIFCAIVIPSFINIPMALVQRTQLAFQEGYRSNMWLCIGTLLSLLSVYITSALNLGAVTLILCSSIIPVVISLLNMMVYYLYQRRDMLPSIRFVRKDVTRKMLTTGVGFFVLSILLAVGLDNIDSLIVARTASISDVSSYSILLKVATILNVIIQMLATPLWAANGEALARGDFNWVKRNTIKTAYIMVGIAIGSSVIILVFSKLVFRIWIGENFTFSTVALAGMLMMQVLFSLICPFFMVLNGAGEVKKQITIFLIFTPLSFGLKYLLSSAYGAMVIPWVGCLCYGLIVIPYTIRIARKIYNSSNIPVGVSEIVGG